MKNDMNVYEDCLNVVRKPKGLPEDIITTKSGETIVHSYIDCTNRVAPAYYYEDVPMTTEEEKKEFATKLKYATKNIAELPGEYSYQYLAKIAGISPLTARTYWNGKAMPGGSNLKKIAKALNCTIDYLMDFRRI